MKRKSAKKTTTGTGNVRIGFQPIVGATRYTIKSGGKTQVFDVIKHKGQKDED